MKSKKTTLTRLLLAMLRCERGEDLMEKSSGLSNAGKAVIAAAVIGAAASGAVALANSSNSASDTVGGKINSAVGATAQTAEKAPTPFSGGAK